MLFILDTDILTILQRRTPPAHERLQSRLSECASAEVATTVVSFQERLQGWLAVVNRPRTPTRLLNAYAELQFLLRDFTLMTVMAYDEDAHAQYLTLQNQRIRIGTLDLRIASIALAHDAVVVTKNIVDFRQVPGLKVEDWTG